MSNHSTPSGVRVTERILTALSWLYPRQFREGCGPDMARDNAALAGEAFESGGRFALLSLIARSIADTVRVAAREHRWNLRRARRRERTRHDHQRTTRSDSGEFMGTLLQDIRYAVRTLAKNPGFTAATVVTLALGIGANTAVFSVINGVLIQPLPYQQDSQLMQLQQHRQGAGGTGFSPKELDDLRAQSATFADFVEYHSLNFTLLGQGEPERVLSGVVTWNFFQLLGVEPYIGRMFLEEDDILTAEPVLLLSYRFWQNSFGGDPGVVGESVRMNDKVHTIVGVLPPFPHDPRDHDVYMPTLACPFRPNWVPRRQARALQVFGRVKE